MGAAAGPLQSKAARYLTNADLSDDELVARVGRGERRAAAILIERHTPRLYAICFRMLGAREPAEDAVQESFLRFWRQSSRWKAGAKVSPWLTRVAMNICIDRLRKLKRESAGIAQLEVIEGGARVDEELIRRERRHAIDQALHSLAPRQRAALTLCYYEEMSNVEAAAAMKISVDALESLLSRGRRSLRRIMSAEETDFSDDIHADKTNKVG